jgi:ketosteroid isomerase-like protein
MLRFLSKVAVCGSIMIVQAAQPPPAKGSVDPELRGVVERFVEAVDKGDIATVAATYSPDFQNVRVADEGGFTRLSREQILAMLKPRAGNATAGPASVPTKDTVIYHAEAIGDMGFVLMIRVKNLGSGWEPMYYSLVWQRQGQQWRLLREFVHQRTVPKWQSQDGKH